MVDTEKLISFVYERKPLWDVQCKTTTIGTLQKKLWLERAEKLKSTSEQNF
jgi:hypothetical protein